ncbi:MAG: BamA/TamA family outer membrane protein [Bacteroidales bacterium]
MLGYFDAENMGINPKPNPEDGTVDIEYVLEEKSNDQIELSGGWSGQYVVGSVRLVLNNFSAKNMFTKGEWRPIPSGDGQQVSLSASVNPRWFQSYSFSFEEPWLGGEKPNSLRVSTYYSLRANGQERTSEDFGDWRTLGITVGIERSLKKPDDFFTLYNDLSLKRYKLNDYSYGLPSVFPDSITSKSISLGTSFGRNSINQPLYPRRGSMFSLRLELTPPHSCFRDDEYDENMSVQDKYKWIEYHKWTFKSKMYTEIAEKLVLETRIDMGFLGYYDKDYRSPFESFDVGGDGLSNITQYGVDVVTLRGYSTSALTPDEGANLYNKFSLELRYPLTLKPEATIYGLVFAEAGNAWTEFENYNPFNIKRSAGFGVRVYIPMMGLLGFDFGYGFDRSDSSPHVPIGGWQPSFVLGQQL